MNVLRKIFGALILLFLGMPILFGIIWGVGIAKGALSSQFYKDLPQMIVTEIPELVNDLIEKAKENPDDPEIDEESRKWLTAMAKVGIPTKEVMEKAGFTKWFEEDLSDSMYLLGKVLSGETEIRSIKLNLRPLKAAITGDYLSDYLAKLIKNLPPCSKTEEEEWLVKIENFRENPPTCNPTSLSEEKIKELIKKNLEASVKEMPDETDILKNHGAFSNYRNNPSETIRNIKILRTLNTYSYVVFLIPFFFIFLGAVVADSSIQGILRWGGGATVITGVGSLALHSFVSGIVKTIGIIPISAINLNYDSEVSQIEAIFSERIILLLNKIFSRLFSKISNISVTIILVGVTLIALSFVITKDEPESEEA